MIAVCQSIMSQIVTDRRQQKAERVKFVQPQFLKQVTGRQQVICHLQHIRPMDVVVVLNLVLVSGGDAVQKKCSFLFIDKLF